MKIKAYLAVIFMQFGIAGLAIIAKSATNHGMSHYSFVVYRQAVAAIVISPFAFLLEKYVLVLQRYYHVIFMLIIKVYNISELLTLA